MGYLLDTHLVLWWQDDDPKLSTHMREVIQNEPYVLVSAASVQEVYIKATLGKLKITPNFFEILQVSGFTELAVTWHHGRQAGNLPLHHNDPFDRMIVAQAQCENLTLLTRDAKLQRYDIDVLLA